MVQAPRWWQLPATLERHVRDLLLAEMAQLRPAGWRWPRKSARGDVDLVQDAGADSLELLSLSALFTEALDLRTESELRHLHHAPTWQAWTRIARDRLSRDDSIMRFATSGSTGLPKRCAHRIDDLMDEMQAMIEVIRSDGHPLRRILLTVRTHHIYGFLFGCVLPAVAALDSEAAPTVVDLHGATPALARAIAQPGDVIVAFPDWWAASVLAPASWPPGVVGMSSTAPCPPAVSKAARERGLSRWIEIYGSTETAGVGWRDDPLAPFTLHRHWRRSADHLQRRGADGQWGHAQQTPDHLQWTDYRRFVPLARRDGVVQVAGINVDPKAVAARLMEHPAVEQAAVRPHPTPAGLRLKAFVVPHAQTGHEELAHLLGDWCRAHLAPVARPCDIRVGSALPRNAMGKPTDWPVIGASPTKRVSADG